MGMPWALCPHECPSQTWLVQPAAPQATWDPCHTFCLSRTEAAVWGAGTGLEFAGADAKHPHPRTPHDYPRERASWLSGGHSQCGSISKPHRSPRAVSRAQPLEPGPWDWLPRDQRKHQRRRRGRRMRGETLAGKRARRCHHWAQQCLPPALAVPCPVALLEEGQLSFPRSPHLRPVTSHVRLQTTTRVGIHAWSERVTSVRPRAAVLAGLREGAFRGHPALPGPGVHQGIPASLGVPCSGRSGPGSPSRLP